MTGTAHAGAVLTIDLAALRSNFRLLHALAPNAYCAAVVKANAYGVGVDRVAPALQDAGCRIFFVATIDEAAILRGVVGVEPHIFVLCGLLSAELDPFLEFALTPVLNDLGQIGRWATWARSLERRLPAAIHFDTGMSRLGLPEVEARHLRENPTIIDDVDVKYVMSHLVSSEEPDNSTNGLQLKKISEIRKGMSPVPASLANSSGIFLGPEYHLDLVRPGVALYGANPRPGQPNPMTEVVKIKSKIAQVRRVDTPQTVGYGAAHLVTEPTKIATIPLGYADGYMRSLSGRGYCYIGGIRVPVVGRVSMDLITLDVTSVPDGLARPGTEVDIMGGPISIDELAEAGNTIAYELLTSLGSRYLRKYLSEAGDI